MKTLSIEKMEDLSGGCPFTDKAFHFSRQLYYVGAKCVFAITMIFTFSCQENVDHEKLQEQIEPDMENLFNNKIWFKNSSKDLELLNENNINEAFNISSFGELNNLNLVSFENYEIRLFEDKEKSDRIYSVNGTSIDGTINTSLILALNDEGEFQVMSSCTCTTTDCAHGWGCNVEPIGPCSCSPCDGTCEKKSSSSDQ